MDRHTCSREIVYCEITLNGKMVMTTSKFDFNRWAKHEYETH